MSSVKIDLNGPVGRGRIVVNDQDLSNQIRGFRFNAEIGRIPILVLDLAVIDVSQIQSGDVEVAMDGATAALLMRAGWTPPEGDARTLEPRSDAR